MIPINKKTPFDRTNNEVPLLRVLIHTDSIADDIINREKVAISLLKMSHFSFLDIHFTPTTNIEVIKVLSDYSVEPCEYCFNDEERSFVSLSGKNFGTIITFNPQKDKLMKEICDKSKVKLIDLIAGHNESYDYFIIGKNDGIHYSKTKRATDITPESALELIRILLVNLGHYYIAPRYTINEGYYYLYRFKKIFNEFQPAWTVVVSGQGDTISEEIINQFDSLSQRLEFICRASDKVSYFSLKYANNDTQDNTLYHLGYLIMLITGVFDDLAWILTYIYGLRLSRMEVILRDSEKKKKRFYKQLYEKNKKLHDFLTSDTTQNLIKMFYPVRDALQHRQFVKGMKYSNKHGYCNNVFALPLATVEIMEKITEDIGEFGLVFSHRDMFLFDSHLFVSKAVEITAYIVNNTLSLIDWESIIATLPKENIEQIKISQEKYEKGLWCFFGFGEEPLYF